MNCDTIQICKHGVPVKFGCPQCISKPAEDNDSLKVWTVLSGLIEHKNYQLDENRKISRRVDELEKLNKACFDADPMTSISSEFGKTNTRIDDLERLVNDFIKSSNGRQEKMQNCIRELEEFKKDVLKVNIDVLWEHTKKRPFRCPNCLGDGCDGSKHQDGYVCGGSDCCRACDNTGIVWG